MSITYREDGTGLDWKCKGLLSYLLGWYGEEELISAGSIIDILKENAIDRETALYSGLTLLRKRGFLDLAIHRTEGLMIFENWWYQISETRRPEWVFKYNVEQLERERHQKAFNSNPWSYFYHLENHYLTYYEEIKPGVPVVDYIEEMNIAITVYLEKLDSEDFKFQFRNIDMTELERNNSAKEILHKYRKFIRKYPENETVDGDWGKDAEQIVLKIG